MASGEVDVGPSVELVVTAVVGVDFGVKRGRRASVGLVEEVCRKREVIAKGVLLKLKVLAPNGLVVALSAVVRASVTFRVDRGSSTSGFTVGGKGKRGAGVLEGSGIAGGEGRLGLLDSSEIGADVVVLRAGTVLVNLGVGVD